MQAKYLKTLLGISTVTATLLLSGCGSTSDSTAPVTSLTTSGQLVDSFVADVNYTCADGTTGVTDENGSFTCSTLPVTFSIETLELGTISILPQDTMVFPQDLAGVNRTDINNSQVLAIAQLLQSCDDNYNPNDGIRIQTQVREQLHQRAHEKLTADNLDAIATDLNISLLDPETAEQHLLQTVDYVESVTDSMANHVLPVQAHGNGIADTDTMQTQATSAVTQALLSPASALTQEAKDTLAYMGNEERLAYDVYMTLYNYHLASGTEIKTLYNIATNSETVHATDMQLLIKKYITSLDDFSNIDAAQNLPDANLSYLDININDLPAGQYNIQAIQDLYDTLVAKGKQSPQDALEVGCMVEVTDINDLDEDIAIAEDSNASDVVTVFEFLRDGSYTHYWAFDSALKNMGVTEGCAVIGEEYNHPEYPQNTTATTRNGHQYGRQ
ncbi:DUF2202 domain-containing protein [Sulfurimonas sp. SWIR-19]|uniref:DUF2202 domain-containing protein n=1 Tax=Sulfurimonas sp. SWIR-19 TaxID=2878390 RepID=UPI001CF59E9B|nr:DUF2202 domain-containing protein [Sulfurimonas sp. SWIR-19]UCN00675.1 DUF2202 domain-containing protein [Sulfurimonas sp. SWIR-19]